MPTLPAADVVVRLQADAGRHQRRRDQEPQHLRNAQGQRDLGTEEEREGDDQREEAHVQQAPIPGRLRQRRPDLDQWPEIPAQAHRDEVVREPDAQPVVHPDQQHDPQPEPENLVVEDGRKRLLLVALQQRGRELRDRVAQQLVRGPLSVHDQGQARGGDRGQENERQPRGERPVPGGPRHLPPRPTEVFEPGRLATAGLWRTGDEPRDRVIVVRGIDQRPGRDVVQKLVLLPSGRDAIPVVRHGDDLTELLHQATPGDTAGRHHQHHDQADLRRTERCARTPPDEQRVDGQNRQDHQPQDDHGQQAAAGEALQHQNPVIHVAEPGNEQGPG